MLFYNFIIIIYYFCISDRTQEAIGYNFKLSVSFQMEIFLNFEIRISGLVQLLKLIEAFNLILDLYLLNPISRKSSLEDTHIVVNTIKHFDRIHVFSVIIFELISCFRGSCTKIPNM